MRQMHDYSVGKELKTLAGRQCLMAFLGFAFSIAAGGMSAAMVFGVVKQMMPGGICFRDRREAARFLRTIPFCVVERDGIFYAKKNGVQAKPVLSLCGMENSAKLVNAA